MKTVQLIISITKSIASARAINYLHASHTYLGAEIAGIFHRPPKNGAPPRRKLTRRVDDMLMYWEATGAAHSQRKVAVMSERSVGGTAWESDWGTSILNEFC